ncbi:MAG TPA: DUF3828 domain-containing protein [Pyrinomonadaceae bacterium]|nr:DUF3828 domain-containing protein [Pyrinomonadaceae bacterium]
MMRFYSSSEHMLTDLRTLITVFALLLYVLLVGSQSSLARAEPEFQLRVFLSAASQQPDKVASPEEVTKQFYTWYFGAKFPSPKRSNMATFRKYVTQSFMKRATARDVDSVLFIDAQDYDESWAKNFTVSPATIDGQKATVQVALNGKEMKYNLNVTLRREAGVWKIDNVKGSET